uniref:Uncharacterized protein n=1 Tax=Kalanchoe fedtschenkoi TaxID=63787 RepID=A0A7N0TD14_KALFE
MAFLLPSFSSPSIPTQSNQGEKPTTHHFHPQSHHQQQPLLPLPTSPSLVSPLTTIHTPPVRGVQVNHPPSGQDKQQQQKDDFYVNLGLAVRTLREDMPLLFTKDLNYDIYRDDITFVDPLNTFSGIENYKLIFWALRFHGKILFRDISLEVFRIWQPAENVILIRWNLKGVPRVPWEAKGQFQGTSRYKLDRNGKIYEHKVDNLAFNFPQHLKSSVSMLDLVSARPASPNPTFFWNSLVDMDSSSWVRFYRSVWETLDEESHLMAQDVFLVTC